MKNKKYKSQASLELAIIFLFVMVLIMGIVYFIGMLTNDINDRELQVAVDNFARNILTEFELLARVEPGYVRNFNMGSAYKERYNVSFYPNEGYFTIEDRRSGQEFFYNMPMIYNITVLEQTNPNSGMEETILRIMKLE